MFDATYISSLTNHRITKDVIPKKFIVLKIEHFALNVPQPLKMADWYVANLGMKEVRKMTEPPFTVFLADDSGRVMIEVYRNPPENVPDYASMDPLQVHLAFVSEEPIEDKERLEKAGAKTESVLNLPDGSVLVMMRDPWGICIQLCKRGRPMLAVKERDKSSTSL